MFHIAICDDEEKFVTHLTGLLRRYGSETGEELRITAYCDGEELIRKYDTSIDLIFLDIKMRLMNGLEAAGSIRRMDRQVGIIFLTSLAQYSLEGYRYQADDYIVKPVRYARLKDELTWFLDRRRGDDTPFVAVANDTGKYRVPLRELRYLETFNRKVLLHTGQQEIVCHRTMRELEQELAPHDFLRCHAGYLVNMRYIQRIEKLDILLTTGEHLPVSQPKRREVVERLTSYWGKLL